MFCARNKLLSVIVFFFTFLLHCNFILIHYNNIIVIITINTGEEGASQGL